MMQIKIYDTMKKKALDKQVTSQSIMLLEHVEVSKNGKNCVKKKEEVQDCWIKQ